MILGLLAKKKVLPIIYHPKLRNTLEDLAFQGAYYDVMQLPRDAAVIPQIARGITDGDLERLARLAAGHFEKLDQILK